MITKVKLVMTKAKFKLASTSFNLLKKEEKKNIKLVESVTRKEDGVVAMPHCPKGRHLGCNGKELAAFRTSSNNPNLWALASYRS